MVAEHRIDPSLLEVEKPINVLCVEDDPLAMKFLEKQIDALGHKICYARNGQESLDVLDVKSDDIDVVLMDREMPVMDGIEAVKRIKNDPKLRKIPVVMITGSDSTHEIKEGLDAGVFYYLTKPIQENMLRSVLCAAVRESRQCKTLSNELKKHRTSFNLIETCKFKFRTLAEAESLAAFMANCYDEPERVLSGLSELMVNAIEHGNLGIGYNKKTELLDSRIWRSEIERMLKQPEYKTKYATATIARKENGIYVVIEDCGQGFEWKRYISIDPARAGDSHGRGIAQARARSFDKLSYNDKGNQVVCFVSHEKQLEW